MSCLWEVLRRLPPTGLLSAARVSRGWRETTKKLWRAAEELRLRVPSKSQIGFVGSVLQKCPGLLRLSLRIESDVDATMLACIAFSCPNLQSLEIFTSDSSVNRISGDELSRFIAEKRSLTSPRWKGAVTSAVLCFLHLASLLCGFLIFTLYLKWRYPWTFLAKKMIAPILPLLWMVLEEAALSFRTFMLLRLCSHMMLCWLSQLPANLRALRMLSLVLGSEITDASVAAIASSFPKLELLDLSGSSISDSGIGMICNVFPETLSKQLLALCPNITSSGIQFAAAQLPRLELLDCGMTKCDINSDKPADEAESEYELQKTPNSKMHPPYIPEINYQA